MALRPPPKASTSKGYASRAVLGIMAMLAATVSLLAASRVGPWVETVQVVVYVVVPGILALGLAASMLSPPSARSNLALLLGSVSATLILSEVCLGLVGYALTALGSGGGQTFDGKRDLRDVVTEHRARGDHAFPTIPASILVARQPAIKIASTGDRVHPLAPSPSTSTSVMCDEGGGPIIYTSDRFGFNNADSVWANPVDVALVGDSYTQGLCVPRGQQIASIMNEERNTVNVGVRAAGPLFELAILREYLAPVKPRTVVWIYYEGNDQYDLSQEERRPWLSAYLDPEHSQNLVEHAPYLDRGFRSWIDSIVASEVDVDHVETHTWTSVVRGAPKLTSVRRVAHFNVGFPSRRSSLGIVPEVIDRASADVRSWGGRFILVFMPEYARYDSWLGTPTPGKGEFMAMARSFAIPVVDLDSVFRSAGDPRTFWASPQGHLNPVGQRVAAAAILSTIDEGANVDRR